MIRNWLSQLSTPTRPARRKQQPVRVTPGLERLETRDAPAITVGTIINITKSAGDDHETMIIVNPANPLNMFAANTAPFRNMFTMECSKVMKKNSMIGIHIAITLPVTLVEIIAPTPRDMQELLTRARSAGLLKPGEAMAIDVDALALI